uniref:Uncharacterized protein n=1 Tax=Acrobeloides nanus TaxID=290746 RepID=A0A914D0V2_9BILA
MCDIRGIYVSPNIEPRFKPITISEVISLMNSQLTNMWQTVLNQNGKIPTLTPVPSSQSIANGHSDGPMSDVEFLDSPGTLSPASSVSDLEIITGTNGPSKKKDKLILITLVNTVYSLWGQSFNSMPEPVIELIPILAHYANETMDEELKNGLIRRMFFNCFRPFYHVYTGAVEENLRTGRDQGRITTKAEKINC